MGAAKEVGLLFLLIVVTSGGFGKSKAAVYKVGDSAGWTIVGHVDYRTWAAQKTFRVGDVIGTLLTIPQLSFIVLLSICFPCWEFLSQFLKRIYIY